jgi:hypothetical protein
MVAAVRNALATACEGWASFSSGLAANSRRVIHAAG